MQSWMLIMFLAYSSGEAGPVALQSEKVDFFSYEECRNARDAIKTALQKDGGFRRSIAVCVERGNSMLGR